MCCRALSFIVLLFIASARSQSTAYDIPEVKLEALASGGFRAYIVDIPGTTLFAFHSNVNKEIAVQALGDYYVEVKSPKDGYWVAEFPKKLNIGDVVHFYVYVTYYHLGYRKINLAWKVTELLDSYPLRVSRCVRGATAVNGATTCLGQSIIDDQFESAVIDKKVWIVEHKIPTYVEPRYEFSSYENRNDTRFIRNNVLYLKPIPRTEKKEVRGELNLRNGCTSNKSIECYYNQQSSFLLPPVKSARITSLKSFQYGKIEIRAKLPAGDWIFPIMQLEPKNDDDPNSAKVWIAYSRGNEHFTGNENDDIGGTLLFGGPVLHPKEPGRSKELTSHRLPHPFYSSFHLYTLEWLPGRMTLLIDNEEYGRVDLRKQFADPSNGIGNSWVTPEAPFDKEFVLSLGVGVGGLLDFPDGYVSGTTPKPWQNGENYYVKKFFKARNVWLRTWSGDNVALQIDYVKVTAV